MFTGNRSSVLRFGVLILALLLFGIAKANQGVAADIDENSEQQESLDVQYARAHLRLDKIDLDRFMEEHRRGPDVLPKAAGEELRRHVAVDEEQLKQALKGPDGDLHQIYVRSAKIALELAEADLKRKQKAHDQFPSRIQAMEVKRAEAVLDVIKLHVKITNAKESSRSRFSS